MSALTEAYVVVKADTSRFNADLSRQLRGIDADKHGRRVGDDFSKGMRGAFRGITTGLVGAFAAIGVGNLLKGFITDAAESAKISRITENAIRATGGAAKISAGEVSELATALSNKTAVDDELIQSGANLLLTFKNIRNEAGKGNDIFDQATAATVDLAAAGFGTVETASIQLGKALNDPIKGMTALGRSGVTFTEQQKEQIKVLVESGDLLGAQGIILQEIQTQVGGAAAAAADPLDRLRVVGGNLGETIGGVLLPYVEQFATYATDHLTPAVEKFIKEFETGEGAGGRLADVFRVIQEKAKVAFDFFKEEILPRLKEFGGAVADGDGEKLSEMFSSIYDSAVKLAPAVQSFVDQLPDLSQLTDAVAKALKFLADHVDTIIKFMPLIVAGFVLYKVAMAAAIVKQIIMLPLTAAQIASNLLLARGTSALAAQLAIVNGVQQVSIFTKIKDIAVTVAQKTAALASAAATKVVAAAQWLWNAAMSANPIGLVIGLIVALVAGIILAYKNSETFRNIVDKLWKALKEGAMWVWNNVLKPFFGWLMDTLKKGWENFQTLQNIISAVWTAIKETVRDGVRAVIDFVLDMADKILGALEKALGWFGPLKDTLAKAREEFNKFRNGVNAALGGIKDKKVGVYVNSAGTLYSLSGKRTAGGTAVQMVAAGGKVLNLSGKGRRAYDTEFAMLRVDEHVWTPEEVDAVGGHGGMARMRRDALAGVFKGYAKGGPVGLDLWTAFPKVSGAGLDAVVTKLAVQLAKAAKIPVEGVASAGSAISGGGGGSQTNLLAFAALLRGMGARTTEHPKLGGVGVHSPGSKHYVGRAFDANYGPGGESNTEKAFFDRIVAAGLPRKYGLRTIWRQPGHFNHAHFDYDRGGLMMPGQSGSNRGTRPERVLTASNTESFDRLVGLLERGIGGPSELVIRDVNGDLIGRMRVEAEGAVRAGNRATARAVAARRL